MKDLVLKMYYDEKILNASKIASLVGIKPRTAQNYVSQDPRYEEYKEKRQALGEKNRQKAAERCTKQKRKQQKTHNMQLEKKIIDDFFQNRCLQDTWYVHTEISLCKKYDIALDKIISILKKDNNYTRLQKYRKASEDSDLEIMHIKDVLLISKGTVVGNMDYLKYLQSAYKLSKDKKKYIYNEQCGAKPYDIPKTIGTHSFLPQKEKQRIETEKFNSSVEQAIGSRNF